MNLKIIPGGKFQDNRGSIRFNNDFDASPIKRLYFISNSEEQSIRGWQGHQIESRWFVASSGAFNIFVVKVDSWEEPSKKSFIQSFLLSANECNILQVPSGYITKIESMSTDAILLAMSDYALGEVQDESRYDMNYFDKE